MPREQARLTVGQAGDGVEELGDIVRDKIVLQASDPGTAALKGRRNEMYLFTEAIRRLRCQHLGQSL